MISAVIHLKRRRPHAGDSALRKWRSLRRETLRRDWRLWATQVAAVVSLIAAVVLTRGAIQLALMFVLGSAVMVTFVGWVVGGDAHTLTWLWGRVGEQQTEEALLALGEGWHVAHDFVHDRGNWDHVVAGPGGLFLLETKAYHDTSTVKHDGLSCGRLRTSGASVRGAAVRLRDTLIEVTPHSPWVQPVVVIWGEFPQQEHEENGVCYLRGDLVTDWLLGLDTTLSPNQVTELAAGLESVRRRLGQTRPS